MASKRLNLSIPEPIFNRLKQERQKYSYTSLQEVVIDIMRDKFYFSQPKGKSARGRPRKLDEMRILTRKRIFGKKGEGEMIEI